MRQVFTSARLENVEAVAQMLRAEGIEVQISNGRSYRGGRRGSFSYRERGEPVNRPAVWIVRAEDQPRGRQLLREAGLLDSSRDGPGTYLGPGSAHAAAQAARGAPPSMRLKLGLLLLIAVVIGLAVFAARRHLPDAGTQPPAPAAAPAPPALVPDMVEAPEAYRADVPTALAARLIGEALRQRTWAQACVAVDDADASQAVLAAAAADGIQLFPLSACPSDATLKLSVREYMTDGSGSGTVQLQVGDAAAQTYRARRDGTTWQLRKAP